MGSPFPPEYGQDACCTQEPDYARKDRAVRAAQQGLNSANRAYDTVTGSDAARTPHRLLLETSIGENMAFAGELASRAERLADVLVGARPEEKSPGNLVGGSNGLLDTLRSATAVQRDTLTRISEALARLERDIG